MSWKTILTSIASAAALCAAADPCPSCPQSTDGWYSAGPCPHMFAERQTGGSVKWKMVNWYVKPSTNFAPDEAYMTAGWRGGAPAHAVWLDAFNAETGRVRKVRQFLPHENDPDFFIRHLQKQYSNDMQTIQGRIKWHGKPVYQGIDVTNRMCKIERFADGTIYVFPFRKPQPYDRLSYHARTNHPAWKANVAKRKAVLEKRRAEIAARKNIIPGLKEAQLKTFDNKHTESNVTVNVNIGGVSNGR